MSSVTSIDFIPVHKCEYWYCVNDQVHWFMDVLARVATAYDGKLPWADQPMWAMRLPGTSTWDMRFLDARERERELRPIIRHAPVPKEKVVEEAHRPGLHVVKARGLWARDAHVTPYTCKRGAGTWDARSCGKEGKVFWPHAVDARDLERIGKFRFGGLGLRGVGFFRYCMRWDD